TGLVIAAIADPPRRRILDALRARDGQSAGELPEALAPLRRHGALKHVGVLEQAGHVVSRTPARVPPCHRDAVPPLELAQRWIDGFGARASAGLLSLKTELEGPRE